MPDKKISRWIEALKNLPLFLFALFSLNHGINILISPVAPRQNYFLQLTFYLLFAYLMLFANFIMTRETVSSKSPKKRPEDHIKLFKTMAYMTLIATFIVFVHIAFPLLMGLANLTNVYAYFALISCIAVGIMALTSKRFMKKHQLISPVYLQFYAGLNLITLFMIVLTTSKLFLW